MKTKRGSKQRRSHSS